MKAYLIRYWETKGIQEIEGEIKQKEYFSPGFFVIDKDVFFDKDKAIAMAEKKRLQKIESLKKRIEKIQKIYLGRE